MTRRRLEVGDGERGRGGGGRGGGRSTIQLVLPTQCRIHIVYTHCLIFIAFNFFLYSMCQGRAAERKSGLAKLSQSRKHLCRKCIFHQSLLISRRVIVFPKESQQGKLFLCSHYGRHESPNTCKKKHTLSLEAADEINRNVSSLQCCVHSCQPRNVLSKQNKSNRSLPILLQRLESHGNIVLIFKKIKEMSDRNTSDVVGEICLYYLRNATIFTS